MRIVKFAISILLITILLALPYYFFFYRPSASSDALFTVETPLRKSVRQEIYATGSLKLKGQVKIGSVVAESSSHPCAGK